MKKKEYQPPKMEVVKMPALGNLLQNSSEPEEGDIIDDDSVNPEGG